MNIEKFCISQELTIMEAITSIEDTKHRGLIVLSSDRKVCGFISQGDILKALLAGASLYFPLKQYVNKSFVYLTERDYVKALVFFRAKNITIIPVVTNTFVLCDVITLADLLQNVNLDQSINENQEKSLD